MISGPRWIPESQTLDTTQTGITVISYDVEDLSGNKAVTKSRYINIVPPQGETSCNISPDPAFIGLFWDEFADTPRLQVLPLILYIYIYALFLYIALWRYCISANPWLVIVMLVPVNNIRRRYSIHRMKRSNAFNCSWRSPAQLKTLSRILKAFPESRIWMPREGKSKALTRISSGTRKSKGSLFKEEKTYLRLKMVYL